MLENVPLPLLVIGLAMLLPLSSLVWRLTRRTVKGAGADTDAGESSQTETGWKSGPQIGGSFALVGGLVLWGIGLYWPASTSLTCAREGEAVVVCTETVERALWTEQTTEQAAQWTVHAWGDQPRADGRHVRAGLVLTSGGGAKFRAEGPSGSILAAAERAEALIDGSAPQPWSYVSERTALVRWPIRAVGTILLAAFGLRVWRRRRRPERAGS